MWKMIAMFCFLQPIDVARSDFDGKRLESEWTFCTTMSGIRLRYDWSLHSTPKAMNNSASTKVAGIYTILTRFILFVVYTVQLRR